MHVSNLMGFLQDTDAIYYLGICYEQGWGTEKNECKAADLYTKASRAGHEGALYNLATFFEDGKGGMLLSRRHLIIQL